MTINNTLEPTSPGLGDGKILDAQDRGVKHPTLNVPNLSNEALGAQEPCKFRVLGLWVRVRVSVVHIAFVLKEQGRATR